MHFEALRYLVYNVDVVNEAAIAGDVLTPQQERRETASITAFRIKVQYICLASLLWVAYMLMGPVVPMCALAVLSSSMSRFGCPTYYLNNIFDVVRWTRCSKLSCH
jgi:hypothetical protein